MPWLLETASGKFIDAFGTRGEADSARKKCGIVGAHVRPGSVPLVRMLATQTVLPRFMSADAFADFLESAKRETYSAEEFTKLTYYTKQPAKLLRDRLTARGFAQYMRGSEGAVRPPSRVVKPRGSFKNEPETPRELAKRTKYARLANEVVDLAGLEAEATKEIDKDRFNKLVDAYVRAFEVQYARIEQAKERFDDAIAELDAKNAAIAAAIQEYNQVVVAAQEFLESNGFEDQSLEEIEFDLPVVSVVETEEGIPDEPNVDVLRELDWTERSKE